MIRSACTAFVACFVATAAGTAAEGGPWIPLFNGRDLTGWTVKIAKRPLGNAPWRFAERPHGHDAEEYWLRWQAMELDRDGLSWDELALRFTLSTPGVSSAIAGSRNLAHMRQNVAFAAKGPLPREMYERIRAAFRRHDWEGKI